MNSSAGERKQSRTFLIVMSARRTLRQTIPEAEGQNGTSLLPLGGKDKRHARRNDVFIYLFSAVRNFHREIFITKIRMVFSDGLQRHERSASVGRVDPPSLCCPLCALTCVCFCCQSVSKRSGYFLPPQMFQGPRVISLSCRRFPPPCAPTPPLRHPS